ncbi:MAG: trypsin-like peptidase domain-containing protein [Candidatus Marinimicrobia bacterium]|nr:trypsin-like peptidase domain-containing protein [Candidatus Neomarinimicrobiota bacterium]
MKKGFLSALALMVSVILLILSFQLYLDTRRQLLFEKILPETALPEALKAVPGDSLCYQRETAITRTTQKVAPAIIGVHVTRIQQYSTNPFFNDPFFRQFFPNSIYRRKIQSLGSGVIISPDGYIVTNSHVLGENALEIYVTLAGGKRYKAERIGSDPLTDIALLKIDAAEIPYVPMGDSDEILLGEWVLALGNPFGLFNVSNQPIVTAGIISSLHMNFGETDEGYIYQDMIQTDASINSGNSGGALVNMRGELIGINTFIFTGTNGSGGGYVGIGFAIPINRVKGIVQELKNEGKIERNWDLGISGQPLTPSIVKYYNLDTDQGVILIDVQAGKAGDKAGLKVGDIILSVNDQEIRRNQDVIDIINTSYLKVGDSVRLLIHREGHEFSVEIKLERSRSI